MAGTYVLKAQPSGGTATFTVTVTVKQTLTSIVVTPGTASLQAGATQQFTAQGLDQFQRAMAAQPAFTWSASGGTISSAGLFTAPGTAGSYSVAAKSGSISGQGQGDRHRCHAVTRRHHRARRRADCKTPFWRPSCRSSTPTAR